MRLVGLVLALSLSAPGRAAVPDPGAVRFPVGSATLAFLDPERDDRTLVTELWYPATADGRDAPPRRGRFPLVLVAHGNCGFRTNYEYLTVHLASRGFLVAAPDFPGILKSDCDRRSRGEPAPPFAPAEMPLDLSFLRARLHDAAGPAGRFARALRGQRTGLVGHSLGGFAVLSATRTDARFPVVVGLAPLSPLRAGDLDGLRPRRAVMVIGGTADELLPFDPYVASVFALLARPAVAVKLVGGTHSGFTDVERRLAPMDLARQQLLVRR